MRIAYVVGTRPNLVKTAPVIGALRRRLPEAQHVVIHTGQHYDRMMSDIFFEELEVPEPDHALGAGSGSHAEQTARVIERLEPVLLEERPDLTMVPGDVNSTLAAAVVTAKLEMPLAHIESGLRSFDRTMPEEINRLVTDQLAQHLYYHSQEAAENMRREGIGDERMQFVGNTMIDTLLALEERFRAAGAAAGLGVEPGGYLLVTLHRPALVDGELLTVAMDRLQDVAADMPVVFPVHPRTRKMLGESGREWPGVKLVDPVGYLDFLSLEADARAVLTDSGGVQEETTFLNIPCFTLRDNTERPVTVTAGTNELIGLAPERISEIVPSLEAGPKRAAEPPPLWDGKASERIADHVAGLAS
jgi:UDP-N-acetylglucosamine 2-epimerase (non-hydrolysing)